jgi:hypothetical protein
MGKRKPNDIKANGWRQGSLIPQSQHHLFAVCRAQSDERLLVLSQDCDLTNDDFQKEPKIELIILKQALELNGNYRFTKNPRELHLNGLGESLWIVQIHRRHWVNRKKLLHLQPDQCPLTKESINLLIRWVVRRYNRTALADELNNRLSKIKSRIDKILNNLDKLGVLALYINGNIDLELEADKKYEIKFVVLRNDGQSNETEISKLMDEMENALESCSISMEFDVLTDEVFTYSQFTQMRLFDADAISWKNNSAIP